MHAHVLKYINVSTGWQKYLYWHLTFYYEALRSEQLKSETLTELKDLLTWQLSQLRLSDFSVLRIIVLGLSLASRFTFFWKTFFGEIERTSAVLNSLHPENYLHN